MAPQPPSRLFILVSGIAVLLLCFWATLKMLDYWESHSDVAVEATILESVPTLNSVQNYRARWEGIQGLNARKSLEKAVVNGQPALELVAIPTEGRHRLGAEIIGMAAGKLFRVGFWVKGDPGTKVALEVRDGKNQNYGLGSFDLARRAVLSSTGILAAVGVDSGDGNWRKIWADIRSSDGVIVPYIVLLNSEGLSTYKGDGKKVIVLGGIGILPAP